MTPSSIQRALCLMLAMTLTVSGLSPTCINHHQQQQQQMSRRGILASGLVAAITTAAPFNAHAEAANCLQDCLKNCKLIAPKDSAYCETSCNDYCAQDDRTDGLSGSVSSSGGETGILGVGTVVKGEDKPPSISLPGLDFGSEAGRKLLGY